MMMHRAPKLHTISASQFLLCLFEHYHEGVLITDQDGILIYYNKAMARLDGLNHQQVLGRSITEIYQLDTSQSITLTALRLARPIINRPHIYRTVDGKLVNSIGSAYPLFDNNALVGAVCTVVDYSSLAGNFSQSQSQLKAQGLDKGSEAADDAIRFKDLIGNNETMRSAVDMARRAASTPSSVMLIGETGTGKELFARAIHYDAQRASGPFMAINCAAIPSALLEGILFGTTKGAFTGAVDKAGLFELANGGTLFLDELNSMPIELQPKLLRALQDRRVRRVGSSRETAVDVKIISAVNDSPFQAIEQGQMRSDLFYRLGVVMVHLPPLRERRDDIEPLLSHFVKKFNQRLGYRVRGFSPGALQMLIGHTWPGNVRELEHAVEAAMNVIDPAESHINLEHLNSALPLTRFAGARPSENGLITSKTSDWSQNPPEGALPEAVRTIAGSAAPPPFLGPARASELAATQGGPGLPRSLAPEMTARPSAPAWGWAGQPIEDDDDFAEEISILSAALRRSRGNVARAAKALGYSPQRLHYRLKKFGLSASDFKR